VLAPPAVLAQRVSGANLKTTATEQVAQGDLLVAPVRLPAHPLNRRVAEDRATPQEDGGYIIRPATERELKSIRRAKNIAAGMAEVPKRQNGQMKLLARKESQAQWRRWGQGQMLGAEDWVNCDHAEGMLLFLERNDRVGARRARANGLLVCALLRHNLCECHVELLDEELRVAERYAERLANYDALFDAYGDGLTKLFEEDETEGDLLGDEDECCQPGCFLKLAFEESLMILEPSIDGQLIDATRPRRAAHLVREVYDNPFSSATLDPSWLTPEVVALATSIYNERSFDRMPELATALEQAGCDNEDILSHCRQSGEHVLGCWVLDGILGR
jgi:hypothetical protein